MAELYKRSDNKEVLSDEQKTLQTVANENIYFLRQGRSLIADLEPEQYSELKDGTGTSTIGAHFRHCIDMYRCFLNGLDASVIDYANRKRDPYVETQKDEAERNIVEFIYRLLELRENPPDNHTVQITFITDSEDIGPENHKIPSSLNRELFMLSSHTVHHYALIAQIMCNHELDCPEHFGVAPSTLAYWKKTRI